MLRFKMVLAAFAFLISTLACSTLLGEDISETDIPVSIVTNPPLVEEEPVVEETSSCLVITDRIMEIVTFGSDGEEENLLDSEVYLVTYTVSGDEISEPSFETVDTDLQDEQSDSAIQRRVWEYFSALIPEDQRGIIAEYSIITDGEGGTLAAVSQTQSDASLWALQVDIADSTEYDNLTFTLVHEFGHLLTLGPGQVPPSLAVFNNPNDDNIYFEEVSACPQYFPGEGCANSDSYINAFYDQFWADIHEEWNDINLEEDEDIYYERLDAFYNKYQDQFVTDYAATNPEEDIAEAWAFFVLGSEPAGDTIAEEKVLFFYQYPELFELRAQILNNLCVAFPE